MFFTNLIGFSGAKFSHNTESYTYRMFMKANSDPVYIFMLYMITKGFCYVIIFIIIFIFITILFLTNSVSYAILN